jgi:hypothetical protein
MKNISRELEKEHLYEGVKQLVELEETKHLHFPQQKLFTLFSIAFQYLLYRSTKRPGAYIIRTEDSALADKLVRRSKDQSTRKFLSSLLIPRKLKYGSSIFYLDFFHLGSWNLTNDIAPAKLQAAIIVKNTSAAPFVEGPLLDDSSSDENNSNSNPLKDLLPPDYYITSLLSSVPKTITIAIDANYEEMKKVEFSFIKKDEIRSVGGVTLSRDFSFEDYSEQEE